MSDSREKRTWQHSEPPRRGPVRERVDGVDSEAGIDEAWRVLLHEHMPFQAIDESTRRNLIGMVRDVNVLGESALTSVNASVLSEKPFTSANESVLIESPHPRAELRRIVGDQSQVMEHIFLTLRLDRYANAPANRGWINLLRQWARIPRFDEVLNEFRPLLSRSFLSFYDAFVRNQPDIELSPVPHPWDAKAKFKPSDVAGYRQRSSAETQITRKPALGVFLDSGFFGPATNVDADDELSADTMKKDAASTPAEGAGPSDSDGGGSAPSAPNA